MQFLEAVEFGVVRLKLFEGSQESKVESKSLEVESSVEVEKI